MTAPARMTPEREAELRKSWLNLCGSCDAGLTMNCTCPTEDYRTVLMEVLDALVAEREHAQQVEVPHSSVAVLGYTVAQQSGWDSAVGWEVIDDHQEIVQLGTFEQSDDAGLHGCVRVAVVRVGADGRIGS